MSSANELQVVVAEGEVVGEPHELLLDPGFGQACVAEWTTGSAIANRGHIRCAKAAAEYIEWARHYHKATVREACSSFGAEVGVSRSQIHALAGVWWRYGHLILDETTGLSARLDSGHLGISNLIAASQAPDPVAMLNEVEDGNYRVKKTKARVKEEREKNAEEEHGPSQVMETRACEWCGGRGWVPIP